MRKEILTICVILLGSISTITAQVSSLGDRSRQIYHRFRSQRGGHPCHSILPALQATHGEVSRCDETRYVDHVI